MRSRAFRRTRVAVAVGAASVSLAAGQAFGAAFGLQTQNASGLGHAYSGGRGTGRRSAPTATYVRLASVTLTQIILPGLRWA